MELQAASFLPPFLTFPWTAADLAAAWWFVFSCHFILCKPQLQIWDQVKGSRWGHLVVFIPVLSLQGAFWLETALQGSAGCSALLHWVSGMRWVHDLAPSFKVILQQRFDMVHFLAFLSAFQNTRSLYIIFHILVSKYEPCPGFQCSYPTVPNRGDGLYGINVEKWDGLWSNNLSLKFPSKIWSDKSYPTTLPICCQGCIFIACYFYI